MNKPNDTDLREALRRREARRPRVEVPDDFLSNVMQKTEAQQHPQRQDDSGHHRPWRFALTTLAAAASIALVVMLTRPVTQPSALGQPIECTQSVNRVRSVSQSSALSQSIERTQSLNRARSVSQKSSDFLTKVHGLPVKSPRTFARTTLMTTLPRWRATWPTCATAAIWHR